MIGRFFSPSKPYENSKSKSDQNVLLPDRFWSYKKAEYTYHLSFFIRISTDSGDVYRPLIVFVACSIIIYSDFFNQQLFCLFYNFSSNIV